MNKKRTLIGLAVVVVLFLGGVWAWLLFRGVRGVPDVSGGITVQAPPGTRLFLGDHACGTGTIHLSWRDLLARDSEELGLLDVDPTAPLTPELVGGPGARSLQMGSMGGGGVSGANVASQEFLLRRADGSLDQVIAILVSCQPPRGRPRNLLLPLRMRAAPGSPPFYITGQGSSFSASSTPVFFKLFGRSPQRWDINWQFTAGTPPAEFAREVNEKGMWEPPGN
jgi:hypothetical protein